MKSLGKKMKWWGSGLVVCLAILMLGLPVSVSAEAKIRIGVIGPMKFSIGMNAWNAAEIAAAEINATGGVNVGGVMHKIDLVQKESYCMRSTVDALNAFEQLVMVDKVDFVVGGYRSEAILAMMDVMAENRMIFINSGAGHPEIMIRVGKNYDKYKYMFRTQVNNERSAPYMGLMTLGPIVNALKKELSITKPKVALLMEKTIAGDAYAEASMNVLPKMGLEVVGAWRPSQHATDVTAELTSIARKEVHIIYEFLPCPAGLPTAQQWGELRIPACLGGMNGPALMKRHWKDTGGMCNYEVGYAAIGPAEITDKTMPFFNRYTEKYGEYPGINSASTYDGIYILKEAIERAGTLKSDAVVVELEKTDYKGTEGRYVYYPKGNVTPHDYMWGPEYITTVGFQWQDGKMVVVSPDGNPLLGDKRWEGVRYRGTKDYKLPPWMVKYWKGKKN